MITKTDFGNTISSLDTKFNANKSLGAVLQKTFKKLESPDLGYFKGKNHFGQDGAQKYLVFQPINRYFKVNMINSAAYVLSWKSKGLSAENIKPPTTSDNSLTPALNYYGTKTKVKFTGSCLKQSKVSYTHGKVVNIYIVYKLGASSSHDSNPTLKICLFGAVTLT